MAYFQIRSTPGSVWPPIPDPAYAQLWSAYQSLDRSQWLAPRAIEQSQLAQLRALLAHCLREIPAYTQSLSQAGVVPDQIQSIEEFRRIPILNRKDYQSRYADHQARRLPEGTRRVGAVRSSGTSGVPVETLQTNWTQLWWQAFYLRDLEWCGIDPLGTLAAIRSSAGNIKGRESEFLEGMSSSHWNPTLRSLIVTGPAHGMDMQQQPRRQIEWLQRVNPDYLLGYPTHLAYLGGLMAEHGVRLPRLRAIQAIAETTDEETQVSIERTFGVPVKNTYSCSEAGYLASPCPAGHGMHVHAENVLLEVVDERGVPCPPGQAGRVLITTLHNSLTPFIRYEIMDEAISGSNPCPCGRGLPTLERVLGKRRPYFHLPNGARKPCNPLVVWFTRRCVCLQYQFVQRGVDDLLIRIVPNQQWNEGEAELLRAKACEHFETPIRVEIKVEPRLDPPPNGKLLGVINLLEQQSG